LIKFWQNWSKQEVKYYGKEVIIARNCKNGDFTTHNILPSIILSR
jgi:hypothetical protein